MKKALDRIWQWWCNQFHDKRGDIINLTPTTYECSRCGRITHYDWGMGWHR